MHGVIHHLALRRPNLRFIQIGANDGVENDPLYPFIERFDWTGVLVEPQPYVFEECLAPLYANNPRVQLVNAAIGPAEGTIPLYMLSFSAKRWATGKATLDRGVLQKSIDSGLVDRLAAANGVTPPQNRAKWIKPIDVEMITVDQLLDQYEIRDFDVLHVDTEGADGMLVRQFDFTQLVSVAIVQFEHFHLDDADLAATCNYLADAGFRLYRDKMDVLAIRGFEIRQTILECMSAPWGRG